MNNIWSDNIQGIQTLYLSRRLKCLKATAVEQEFGDSISDEENILEKYDSHIELYKKSIKQWDTNTIITMIIRGISKK
ncbi:MAG: hypothetical protein NC313_12465 [Butyrivibrio sp.]|nr:hypothetical protein [Butyrivibrio sp.]